jgi:hypothetical protein
LRSGLLLLLHLEQFHAPAPAPAPAALKPACGLLGAVEPLEALANAYAGFVGVFRAIAAAAVVVATEGIITLLLKADTSFTWSGYFLFSSAFTAAQSAAFCSAKLFPLFSARSLMASRDRVMIQMVYLRTGSCLKGR